MVCENRYYLQWENIQDNWIFDRDYPEGFDTLIEALRAKEKEISDFPFRSFRVLKVGETAEVIDA